MVSQVEITLEQAFEGFALEKRAARRSAHTLADYGNAFRKLAAALGGERLIDSITADEIKRVLRDLGERPQVIEGGVAPRAARPLSKKSVLNVHTALSSLWSWAVREGYAREQIMERVPRPRPERREIVPYSREDVEAMLQATYTMAPYERNGREVVQPRSTGLRDRAIVLLLLDTGIRAEELAGARMGDLDVRNSRLRVFGKGAQERIVSFVPGTARVLWRYLATRACTEPEAPLFVAYGTERERISSNGVWRMVSRLGKQAGIVPRATVHRFRHTFAIEFLRNQGNVYALQRALGHSTLEMVRRYLAIVQGDVEREQQRASPVANWRLRG